MDLSPLLEIDSSLSDDTIVYRIVDFFSATTMVSENTLMFTRSDKFFDPNEAIDRLFSQLQSAIPGGGCGGMGWSDKISAKIKHDEVKKSHFVSCWSKAQESVAMWSLYSPDLCSVRIETTIGKLRQASIELLDKYSILKVSEDDEMPYPVISISGLIAPVHYEELDSIRKKLSRRFQAHKRILKRYERNGQKIPTISQVNKRFFEREQAREIETLNTTCRLKDKSFEHEQEIRVIIRLGETRNLEAIAKMKPLLNPAHEYHSLFSREIKFLDYISRNELPEREFVRTESTIVNSVAIDPRCPPHKEKFMRQWFSGNNINVVASKSFGYAINDFTIFPDC